MEQEKLMRNGPDGSPYEVKLKNPGTHGIEDYLIVIGEMGKIAPPDMTGKTEEEKKKLDEEHFRKLFSSMSAEGKKAIGDLVRLTLNKTYPNKNEDDDSWGMENFMIIFPMVIEMCTPKDRETIKKNEILDRVKDLQKSTP